MIKVIVLNFGYVESAAIAPVIYFTESDYKTPLEALASLGKVFRDRFDADRAPREYMKGECCKKQKRGSNFCSKCGANLLGLEFDMDEFIEFVRAVSCYTNDDYNLEVDKWTPYFSVTRLLQFSRDEILEISSMAEHFIAGVQPEANEVAKKTLEKCAEKNCWDDFHILNCCDD